ncbi:MAG: hypothetical protein P0S95_06080 [Rhabdochlamydiaceae bacterium]|nr:hypothetical protein [Candidatus Amphrikana amoebophyrae]
MAAITMSVGALQDTATKKQSDETPVRTSILSRITAAQNKKLYEYVESVRGISDAVLKDVCTVIISGDLSNPLFEIKDWMKFAFYGHEKKLITPMQLAAASHLDLCLSGESKVTIGSVDNKDDFNHVVMSLGQKSIIDLTFDDLSGLEKLVCFVPIRSRADRSLEWKEFQVLTFIPFIQRDECCFISLSIPVIQRIYNAVLPYPVTLYPTLGYSMRMSDFLGDPSMRTVAVDSNVLPQNSLLHGRKKCSGLSTTIHDSAFHALLASYDPYRDFETSLANHLWDLDKEYFKGVVIELADKAFLYEPLNAPHFPTHFKSSKGINDQRFWFNVVGRSLDRCFDVGRSIDAFATWYNMQTSSILPSLESLALLIRALQLDEGLFDLEIRHLDLVFTKLMSVEKK